MISVIFLRHNYSKSDWFPVELIFSQTRWTKLTYATHTTAFSFVQYAKFDRCYWNFKENGKGDDDDDDDNDDDDIANVRVVCPCIYPHIVLQGYRRGRGSAAGWKTQVNNLTATLQFPPTTGTHSLKVNPDHMHIVYYLYAAAIVFGVSRKVENNWQIMVGK